MLIKNLNFKTVLLALFIMLTSGMSAQVTVTGTVSDENGEPIIGATVREKGTTAGAATDIDGNFALKVKDANATLVFTYVGFEPIEIALKGRTNIDVVMSESLTNLNELVVVGYGTMKKSDLAGASSTLGQDALKGSVITNLDQSLQGRAAGVTAITTSGAPGSSSSIRVRGQATINANAEPLYVIDGVIVQGGGNSGADFGLGDALGNGKVSTVSPLSTLNPSDILSMEILKDASATAIYGSQGANGVVLITTKRGKSGEAKFTYEGNVSIAHQEKRLDMMNLREFATFYNDLVATGQQTSNPYYADPSLLGVGTNWQDAIFRTAVSTQHQVAAQGGTEKVQYYVSGSFMNQEGTLIGSNFRRFSFRANLDAQLKSWLKLGLSATYSDTNEDLKLADGEQGIINYSLTTVPDIPIYDIDGNYSSVVREGYTNPNPVALAMLDDINLHRQKLTGNVFFDVTPIKNLTWHAEFDYDVSASKGDRYKPMVDLGNWVRSSNSSSIQKNSSFFWAVKNYVSYNGEVSKLSYSAMIGQEAWESKYNYTSISNTMLPSDEVHNPALGTGTPAINAGWGSSAMASFFTRETLNWDNRYLATYTFRYDGSSNFGPKNRWAGFNSVALAWRFSNEKFMQGVAEWWSNGKLRLGWGQTGNSNIGAYAWGSLITRMPSGLGMGYRPANIANEAIKWETQEQWNIGLDLSFLNDRLSFTGDAYIKRSKDMLMSMQLPSYMGTQGNGSSALQAPKGNYGEIENKGLELELTGRPFIGEFEWESSFQISFNKNKLVALSGTENANLVGYGQWSDVVSISEIGQPLYNFYGYVVEGVYKDIEDIQNSPKPAAYPSNGVFNPYSTVWPGDIKFKDINGDGKIDENDRTVIGNPLPDFTFGFNNTFRWKGFDLNIFINGSYGNDVMNYLGINLTHMNSAWMNQLNKVNDRAILAAIDPHKVYTDGAWWYNDVENVRVQNPGTMIPRATTNDPNDNDRISSRYIEDGSYIRIKNITLGYTFPKKWMQKIYLENLRIYCNLQNVHTFTKYSGYDPEVGASTQDSAGLVYGLDFGRYPSPFSCTFGLNVTF
ncbi:MAG: TonB-dependent receptor [Muribaculaceae bacterium]|nr:TonB-dependent receptor [Muribaculaceae bacterium]